ncbi:MAG TPA: DUF3168 domain-containing protein [Allosphingosinicella sp.]|nr:DUF3168 domain-containing protein [Allosphingosinicella sp.]
MPDLKLAAQVAIYEVLSALPALAPFYQHVPGETQPPYSLIGDMSTTPMGGKSGGLDRIDFEILHYVREPGREFLTPRMAAAREALEGQALTADGVELSPPVFEGEDDGLLEDGQTYEGVQRFSLFAQPA